MFNVIQVVMKMIGLLLIILGSGFISGFPYNVRNLEHNGFITEQIDEVQMYDDIWKMVAYVNISNYRLDFGRIIMYESHIGRLYSLLKAHHSKSCALIPEQLKLIIKDIVSLNILLPINQRKERHLEVSLISLEKLIQFSLGRYLSLMGISLMLK